jgi:diguanylate cyclase (GGDEF)-like protein
MPVCPDALVPDACTAGVLEDGLRGVWEQHRAGVFEQLRLIERAVAAAGKDELYVQLRGDARRTAHMVGGSTAMFGFTGASKAACELESELAGAARASLMASLVATLRGGLEAEAVLPRGARVARSERELPAVLVVGEDPALSDRILTASSSRELSCATVTSSREARILCVQSAPALVLLDLAVAPEARADTYELLSELSARTPPIAVLVLTGSGTFTDRIEAARGGSRAFLPRSLAADDILSAAEQLLVRGRLAATRVLIVDDDPATLDAMRVLLAPADLSVFTLADPLCFWERLEQVEPELLILDVNMPGANGLELCRTVRNDPRWSGLAVIFASWEADEETVERAFNAGADDYVAKPIAGPELLARVANRLERVRLYRAQAETDGLTGLPNRVTSEESLKRLALLSDGSSEPLSIVMLDVDRFKLVNDTHSHSAGDRVLRRVGEYLRHEFRDEDVAGRWGGEEFIVGLGGVSRASATRRLADMQERFAREDFPCRGGTFRVSFSAGVAEYPLHGGDIDAVCHAADEALYRAKEAGRARVLAAA